MRDTLKSSVAALSSGAKGSTMTKDAGVELSDKRTYKLRRSEIKAADINQPNWLLL
jgi:hypothetical protein